MEHRTIAVYVNQSEASKRRVLIACEIASRMNAILMGMSCEYISASAFADGAVSNRLLKLECDRVSAVLAEREKTFRSQVGKKNAHVKWRQNNDYPLRSTLDQLRAADLFVIGSDAASSLEHRLNPATVLMQAGRPILYIPDQVASAALKNVVVGWKDAREARRALLDAVPYLQMAKNVLLVGICEDTQAKSEVLEAISDVACYLSSRGVGCELKVVSSAKRSAGDEIIAVAKDFQADVIVAGAYGRSQVGEWIFGGVTETLLDKSPIACLLSH